MSRTANLRSGNITAPRQHPGLRTQDSTLPIDARLIEAERERLWRRLARHTAGGLVRASSLSLLVIQTDQTQDSRVRGVLEDVAAQHRCRVILVAVCDAEPAARVVLQAQDPARPAAYWEEISLTGGPADLNRMMSAVELLVLPNLPVQAWWPGDPSREEQLFHRVVEIADRVIIDSRGFSGAFASLAWYARQAAEEHGTVGFVDVGWRRLEPWRVLLAQFFDSPADRPFLNDVQSVVVEYQSAEDGERIGSAEALLLVGWLASRLGWSPNRPTAEREPGLQRLSFDNAASSVTALVTPVPPSNPRTVGLAKVEVRAGQAGRAALYTIERSGEKVTTAAKMDGARREGQFSLPIRNEAELLARELAGFGRDRIYEEALQIVRLLEEQAGPGSTRP